MYWMIMKVIVAQIVCQILTKLRRFDEITGVRIAGMTVHVIPKPEE